MFLVAVTAALVVAAGARLAWSISAGFGSMVDDALGFLGDVASWLIGPLIRVVGWILETLESVADQVFSSALELIDGALDVIGNVLDTARAWFNDALVFVGDAINDVAELVNNIIHEVGSMVGDIADQLAYYVSRLGHIVGDVLDQVWEHILRPVTELIYSIGRAIWDDVVGPLVDEIVQLVLDAIGLVGDFTDLIKGLVEDVLGGILEGIQAVIDLVTEAWDWLVYFATHPFSWFTDLIDGFFSNGAEWLIEKLSGAIEAEGSHLEDLLVRFINLALLAIVALVTFGLLRPGRSRDATD